MSGTLLFTIILISFWVEQNGMQSNIWRLTEIEKAIDSLHQRVFISFYCNSLPRPHKTDKSEDRRIHHET